MHKHAHVTTAVRKPAPTEPKTLTAAVRAKVRQIKPGVEFTLADVGRIAEKLAPSYPPLAEGTGTVRCTLQRLRRDGLLFVSPGHYKWSRKAEAAHG